MSNQSARGIRLDGLFENENAHPMSIQAKKRKEKGGKESKKKKSSKRKRTKEKQK